ncbi:MAG: hypothetical protein QXR48_01280 [Candidatus Woesearchaeota archaeon]
MVRLRSGVFGFFVGWISRLIYVSSLASLIPFGAMIFTSAPAEIPVGFGYFPLTALGLLGVSALILFCYHRNLARTFASLGLMTLIPGIGALVLMLVNKDVVFAIFARFVFGFGKIEPYLNSYIESAIPNTWLFIIAYVLLGFLFLYVAVKIKYRYALVGYFRRVFGSRARIYKQ